MAAHAGDLSREPLGIAEPLRMKADYALVSGAEQHSDLGQRIIQGIKWTAIDTYRYIWIASSGPPRSAAVDSWSRTNSNSR